jgi:hypothetical protein
MDPRPTEGASREQYSSFFLTIPQELPEPGIEPRRTDEVLSAGVPRYHCTITHMRAPM